MKPITNPLRGTENYHCFGCDPDSEHGLRMTFFEDGDYVVSEWKPRPEFQGWRDTLHGGIQATLIDEISSWVIFSKYHTSGVTTSMEVKYRKPVMTTQDHITLKAKVLDQRRNLVRIGVELFDLEGVRCTEATCTYFIYPQEKAKHDLEFKASPAEAHTCTCGCAHKE